MDKNIFPSVLITHDVTMRPHETTPDYAAHFCALVSQNYDRLAPWFKSFDGKRDDLAFFGHYLALKKAQGEAGNHASYGLFSKSGVLIGEAGIFLEQSKKTASLDFWLDRSFTRKGFATQIVHALEDDLFRKGIDQIELEIDMRNVPSMASARKMGYQPSMDCVLYDQEVMMDEKVSQIFVKTKGDWLAEKEIIASHAHGDRAS